MVLRVTTLDQLFASRIATIVPEAVGPTLAAEVRAQLDRTGYTRFALLDRGSYEVAMEPDEPALVAALAGVAREVTGRSVVLVDARALRLGPGDYVLAHHDRRHADPLVELMLDLSAASVPGADVHYRRHGKVVFHVVSRPGALSVVERSAETSCHHAYVSKRYVGACVVRLVVRLRDA
jgi:sarcosine oxidase gamma subunit